MKHGIVLAIIWGRRYVGHRQETIGSSLDIRHLQIPFSKGAFTGTPRGFLSEVTATNRAAVVVSQFTN
jgi:hypothetical protein